MTVDLVTQGCKTLFFVKAPVSGSVKTRLAKDIGDKNAVMLYKAFVLDILERLTNSGFQPLLYYTPPESLNTIKEFLGENHVFYQQLGNDLGERMANAFSEVFDTLAEKALLIGSDTIDIKEEEIKTAFHALTLYDAVIGPSEDGGFYLIGFKKNSFKTEYFLNVRWSSPFAMGDIIKNLESSCSIKLLEEKRDIDTFDDLRAVFNKLKHKNSSFRTVSLIENEKIL